MFLHISTDQIICLSPGQRWELPFFCIEKDFGPRLHDIITQQKPKALYVLNGPGSFTTLRVGAVAINILAQHYGLSVYTSTKGDLFDTYATAHKTFPTQLALTLGQKKQCRLYTCGTQQYKKISFEEWKTLGTTPIDYLHDISLIGGEAYKHRIIYFSKSDDAALQVSIDTHQRSVPYTAACRQKTDILTPAYLMEPTV